MRYSGAHRAWFVLALAIAASCANRPTKPLVLTEQVGELPVQFASPHCQIPLLSAPPAQPYEVIAQVKTYGNPGTDMAEMQNALHQQKAMVDAGQWLLYRYNPDRAAAHQNPLQLDTKSLKMPLEQFLRTENRFNQLLKGKASEEITELFAAAQEDVDARWKMYSYLAAKGV